MSAAMPPEDHAIAHCSPPGMHVRHLWLGPISSAAEHDLSYASTAWPITLVHRILSNCPNLRALAMVNLAQQLMYRLDGVIPATVENIYLGPVHGHMDLPRMRCYRNLRSITSFDTYLSDWEVQEMVTSPYIHRLRRFFSKPTNLEYALDQLPCVKKATSLQELQIICCDDSLDDTLHGLYSRANGFQVHADNRTQLVAIPRCLNGCLDSIHILHQDWRSAIRPRLVDPLVQYKFGMTPLPALEEVLAGGHRRVQELLAR
ncbi:hypothetical protein WOLCODRAFT_125770 [Wolfiporia cocos MD-104 SS10]|uniref:F-box domain-containing protein n=1 Tax=Wolfiporia cocos (strain MD-104) TaxID=742152 RepID=A0A2H3JH75_WOLCO|nr:hypothetical protein WOLCODRAFT_125770 [Wolfiporia cocos MD-104 SS10]